jgi:NAD/NADP transhydrogenase beta subunit
MDHGATTTFLNGSSYFIELTYLIASILFILGLKAMSHPDSAR